jgi:hypothetical protein
MSSKISIIINIYGLIKHHAMNTYGVDRDMCFGTKCPEKKIGVGKLISKWLEKITQWEAS